MPMNSGCPSSLPSRRPALPLARRAVHVDRLSSRSAAPDLIRWMAKLFLLLLLLGSGEASAHLYAAPRTSIRDIQFGEFPDGSSPYTGQVVTVSGTVTAAFRDGFALAEAPGAWGAVYVYTKRCAPDVGEAVELVGTVIEHYGMTQLADVSSCQILPAKPPIFPVTVSLSQLASEAYESVLVTVENVTVTNLVDCGEWIVSDGMGSIHVDDKNDYMYFPSVGDTLQSITGVLFYSFGAYKIEPRATADLVGDPLPHYALRGDIVTLNDRRDFLVDSYVEILGDRILALSAIPPDGIPIIETDGLIFPGLIDAHNHPFFNVLGRLRFGRRFANRYQWQAQPLYWDFRTQYAAIRDYGGAGAQATDMFRLAELRALSVGTTMIQGFNCNGHENDAIARQGVGINNAERFPSRAFDSPFPLSEDDAFWQERARESWERFLIHLAEGTDKAALDEFYIWRDMGMLDGRTTIIHGIPLGPTEWALMAAADAHLVWSPMSNWSLYGTTANVPQALAAGVNVALAPDWLASGSAHLLAELKFADYWDDTHWGNAISPQQLVEFVTRNAAFALGIGDWAGQVSPGFRADLAVVQGDRRKPYRALVWATPADMLLTIVSGRPMAGDPVLMGQFTFLGGFEELPICGTPKAFAVQIASHAVPEASRPISDTLRTLRSAYDSVQQKVSDFAGLEDTTPPILVVDGPHCATMPYSGRPGNRVDILAFDDCCLEDMDMEAIQVLNRTGAPIDVSYEIVGEQLYIERATDIHAVRINVSARDKSGNIISATHMIPILPCCSYVPLLLSEEMSRYPSHYSLRPSVASWGNTSISNNLGHHLPVTKRRLPTES